MRDINEISAAIIKYLREGGSAAALSIQVMNKEIKALLLEVNRMILNGELRRSIEAFVRSSIKKISTIVNDKVINSAIFIGNKESKAIGKSIASIAGVTQRSVKTVKLTDTYVKAIMRLPMQTQNYSVEDAFKTVGINLSRNTTAIIRRSYEQGKTVEEISAIFMKQIKTVDLDKANRNLNTIVRTAISQVANSVRLDTYTVNKKLIDRVLYVAVLDSRTSSFCAVHDGRTYKLDEVKPTLPAHFNCRSTYVPVLKTDSVSNVKDQLKRPKDAKGNYQSYEDWLTQQSREEQINILGQKAYNTFSQSGKLNRALNVAVV